MRRDYVILVLGSVLAMALMTYLAARFSGEGSARSVGTTTQRFTTEKPRENARALISEGAPKQADVGQGSGKGLDKPLEAWNTPGESGGSAPRMVEEAPTVVAARGALHPEEGLAVIDARLADEISQDERARLMLERARLQIASTPGDDVLVLEALKDAYAHALLPVEIQAVMLIEVEYLLSSERYDEALERLNTEVALDVVRTVPGTQLVLLKGRLKERSGAFEEAEEVYRETMQVARVLLEEGAWGAEEVYRQAAMHLGRSLRRNNQDAEADILARRVRERLDQPGS